MGEWWKAFFVGESEDIGSWRDLNVIFSSAILHPLLSPPAPPPWAVSGLFNARLVG